MASGRPQPLAITGLVSHTRHR